MAILSERYSTLSLAELPRSLEDPSLARELVVVTFDDGYPDNLYHALPVLERYGIPATVFVATARLNSSKEFWTDELERVFLTAANLPEHLHPEVSGLQKSWQMERESGSSTDEERWDVTIQETPSGRHAAYRELRGVFRHLPPAAIDTVMARIRRWACLSEEGRPNHRGMTSDELGQLARSRWIEIGAHTVRHPCLSSLDKWKQREEIRRSKEVLENILGEAITSFAYPFGQRTDYNRATVEEVKTAGFRLACANFPSVVTSRSDKLQLPRQVVRDWSGERFEEELQSFFAGPARRHP